LELLAVSRTSLTLAVPVLETPWQACALLGAFALSALVDLSMKTLHLSDAISALRGKP